MEDGLASLQRTTMKRATSATRYAFPAESALDGDQLYSFLSRKSYAALATTRRDLRPHLAMILFCVWSDRFWLPSVSGAVRLSNLRWQPQGSLTVTEGEGNEHVVVTVEGRCQIHTAPPEVFKGDFARTWRARLGEDLPRWAAALIELRPSAVYSFAGSKARF